VIVSTSCRTPLLSLRNLWKPGTLLFSFEPRLRINHSLSLKQIFLQPSCDSPTNGASQNSPLVLVFLADVHGTVPASVHHKIVPLFGCPYILHHSWGQVPYKGHKIEEGGFSSYPGQYLWGDRHHLFTTLMEQSHQFASQGSTIEVGYNWGVFVFQSWTILGIVSISNSNPNPKKQTLLDPTQPGPTWPNPTVTKIDPKSPVKTDNVKRQISVSEQ